MDPALLVDVVEVGRRAGRDLGVAGSGHPGQREGAADLDGVVGDAGLGLTAASPSELSRPPGSARAEGEGGREGGDQWSGDPGCALVMMLFPSVWWWRDVRTTAGPAPAAEAAAQRPDDTGGGEQDHGDHHQPVDQRGQLGGLDVAEPGVLADVGDHAAAGR